MAATTRLPFVDTRLPFVDRRPLPVLVWALAVVLVLGCLVTPGAAAAKTLPASARQTTWATLGSARLSTLASVAVIVPGSLPVDVGLQLRASSHSSGYRATLAVGANGTVSGSISRVNSGSEATLLPTTDLGLRVTAGQRLYLQAAVVAKARVWVYLRAWTSPTSKPSTWQLAVSDASANRHTRAGRTYLFAEGTQDTISYSGVSVASYSAGRAAAVGVVPPEPGGDTFSIAVLPDTQDETSITTNAPFLNRVRWMVAHRGDFDLRYVLHTGDVTNWGWLDPAQLSRAGQAIGVLADAGIPYSLTIGNHDTAAVGWSGHGTSYGGSAYMYNPECPARLGAAACRSDLLVRHTEAFNRAFPVSSIADVGGVFETGRIDNNWTTFSANGTRWLVLTLELWPRTSVVKWARDVVAAHPGDNVIIQTHSYLTSGRVIAKSNGGYGATSPRYLYDQVVSKFPNVKLVFSGHTGGFGNRVDTPNGNTVVSYLGNHLAGSNHNPVRLVSINTATGDVFTIVHDPLRNRLVSSTSDNIRIVR